VWTHWRRYLGSEGPSSMECSTNALPQVGPQGSALDSTRRSDTNAPAPVMWLSGRSVGIRR
jgi:hypothetical protein